MKAILTTRCGCSREFPITFPPPLGVEKKEEQYARQHRDD